MLSNLMWSSVKKNLVFLFENSMGCGLNICDFEPKCQTEIAYMFGLQNYCLYHGWVFLCMYYLKNCNVCVCVCVCVFSSANATPAFEGRGGMELATEITNLLYHAYSASTVLDVTSLCLQPGKLCWVLYVDVLVSCTLTVKLTHLAFGGQVDSDPIATGN